MTHTPCPSCGEELHLTPKRRGKCKVCGAAFLLNKNGQIYGPIITKEQNAVELAFRELDCRLNVGVRGFRKLEHELEQQFGFKPPARDVIWGLYQRAGPRHSTDPEFQRKMAGFLADEGKEPTLQLTNAAKFQLARLGKPNDITRRDVVDIFATTCCDACRKLDSKRLPNQKALATMPIPNPECTNTRNGVQFCTCHYEAIIDYRGTGLEPPPKSSVATVNGPVAPPDTWWDAEDAAAVSGGRRPGSGGKKPRIVVGDAPKEKSKGLWGWLRDHVEIEW